MWTHPSASTCILLLRIMKFIFLVETSMLILKIGSFFVLYPRVLFFKKRPSINTTTLGYKNHYYMYEYILFALCHWLEIKNLKNIYITKHLHIENFRYWSSHPNSSLLTCSLFASDSGYSRGIFEKMLIF